MDEENKPIEAKEVPKPAEEKKENIMVIKKWKIALAFAVAIIIIGTIIGYRLFFTNNNNGKIEYIADYSPVLGNESATVDVIEFSDYECPYCEAAEGSNKDIIASLKQNDPSWEAPIPNIIEQYVNTGKVKIVFRDFPLTMLHQYAMGAVLASACAQEQGKFWEYHNALFDNYNALSDTDLKEYAANLNMSLTQFSQCLDSKKYQDQIKNDMTDGQALGVSSTPTFFVGNNETGYEKVSGAESFSVFKQIIDSKISV